MSDPESPSRLERVTAALEKHPARTIAGVVLTAVGGAVAFFLLGFNYRKEIQEAALIDLVPRGSYVLKSDLPEMLTAKQVSDRYIDRLIVDRDYILRKDAIVSSSQTHPSETLPMPSAASKQLAFSTRAPFPAGYDTVTPGMKFSDATRLFPGGQLRQGSYQVRLADGLFATVLFLPASHVDTDPTISVVAFNLLEGGTDAAKAALKEYGSLPHRNEVLGSRVVWPNLNGFELAAATDSLMISRRE